ncbi:MAG: cation:proton antiporter [Solirubrobacteraceae bacterium]|nr:cation:proton antiporter [Solirubrobacteraceae bacterium]
MGGAFLAAGLLARLGRRIELPTIPLFMLAGILLGPHTPGIELFDDPDDLKVLGALGLIFLLLYIGLELSVDDLVAGGGSLIKAGVIYLGLNVGGGLLFGFAIGWGAKEALVLAGIMGISSSAIVSKLLIELGHLKNPETPLILGIIVIEDLFLAFYLALLSPVLGDAQNLSEAAVDILVGFLVLATLGATARFGGKAVGRLIGSDNDELLIIVVIGFAVLVSGLSEELGVKYAIGALLVGMIIAATEHRDRVEHLMHPLRDTFGALFFFSFGLTIKPGDVVDVIPVVLAACVVTFALNLIAGVLAARTSDLDTGAAANIGLTLLSRGEFAMVLGALAAGAGLDPRLTAFVAGYVLILAIFGPMIATRGDWVAGLLSRPSPAGS